MTPTLNPTTPEAPANAGASDFNEDAMNRIEEIKARLAATTPGPWQRQGYAVHEANGGLVAECGLQVKDAKFIAAAADDIRYLLAELQSREVAA